MAGEYSYNELMQMQEKAIRRVHQMQERARQTMKNNPLPDLEFEEREEEKSQPDAQRPDTQGREAPPQVKAEKVNIPNNNFPNQGRSNPLSNLLTLDGDKAMILPLLMLLGKEGADNILLIALMYIIA